MCHMKDDAYSKIKHPTLHFRIVQLVLVLLPATLLALLTLTALIVIFGAQQSSDFSALSHTHLCCAGAVSVSSWNRALFDRKWAACWRHAAVATTEPVAEREVLIKKCYYQRKQEMNTFQLQSLKHLCPWDTTRLLENAGGFNRSLELTEQ